MARFPFSDLHSFKDFVGFVRMCAPDQFPIREGRSTEEQWTLELAFSGLNEGMSLAVKEKGDRPEFNECKTLIAASYEHYKCGREDEGFFELDKAYKILKKIRTQ